MIIIRRIFSDREENKSGRVLTAAGATVGAGGSITAGIGIHKGNSIADKIVSEGNELWKNKMAGAENARLASVESNLNKMSKTGNVEASLTKYNPNEAILSKSKGIFPGVKVTKGSIGEKVYEAAKAPHTT